MSKIAGYAAAVANTPETGEHCQVQILAVMSDDGEHTEYGAPAVEPITLTVPTSDPDAAEKAIGEAREVLGPRGWVLGEHIEVSDNAYYCRAEPAADLIICTEPDELHCHYPGQFDVQGAFVALDLEAGDLYADYNPEIGSGIPMSVYHGQTRRWTIPVLTGTAANRLLAEILPLAGRMLADWENEWDGSNHVARLGADACAAEAEIEALCDSERFDMSDLVSEYSASEWFEGDDNARIAAEHGITATTADDRITEIAAKITRDATTVGGDFGWLVVEGVEEYLTDVRDELADAAGCE